MLLRASSAACYSSLGDHRRLSNPSARATLFLNFRRRPFPLPPLKQPMSSIPPRSSQTRALTGSADAVSSERKDDLPMHVLSNTKVGILGGGQLGKMMCQAASCMAIKVLTLDPLEKSPASGLSYCHVVGDFNDGEAVREFAKRCDLVTIEIEHVDAVMLEKLEQQGIDCQPKASTIKIIQDKYLQKDHFSQHGIPLPEFMQIDNIESAERAGSLYGYPLMIKCRRLAYDGRGNAVAHSKEELSSAVAALGGFDRALYVERWTPFVKELSVIVARGRDGCISCYPVVETIHKNNICHIVEAPADVPEKIKELSLDVAQKAVSSLEGAGIFAVELFLTGDGQVLLNEVAPRPHNSGHHTIESCYTSQYEQHLRAVLGLPLGDPSMKTPAAIMYNILGEDEGEPGLRLAHELIGRALKVPGASIHWYDKPDMRKLRKMGHITITGPSMNIVKARLDSMLNKDQSETTVIPQVAIIMGSDSDLPIMKEAAVVLKNFDVPFEVTIVSAHRTPDRMYSFASSAKKRGIQVIIAGAGGAAHLPGMVASLTSLPVIGVPVRTASLDGVDSLLSIVQMPKGIPVATVAIGNAANAALLAVRILANGDAKLSDRVVNYQEVMKDTVLTKAEKLEHEGWEQYLNS